jgi:two-component system response regulator HydG
MRVLLADDEITIAVTLSDALEEAGFEVTRVEDTSGALAALEEGGYDLVLTDIRMPGAGGMAVLERSVELDPGRPVIIMTGFAEMADASRAVDLGAKFYVQKPFRNEAMVALVETYARVRSLEVENQSLRERLR